ncbi:hypothetical protein QAD02_005230 [Eretmocerus hayati]|uniref:Uncharacterized protein n=1 Tax=Eretmocerus hayati TaxID=131215 RepID=A0ACC2NSZ7_9HYME|nr:hypothetical protein QAD02_005230 [Eretmocerus hayati]
MSKEHEGMNEGPKKRTAEMSPSECPSLSTSDGEKSLCIPRKIRKHTIETITKRENGRILPPARTLLIERRKSSPDQLLMRDDNLVHFLALDCVADTEVSEQLVDLELIDLEVMKNEPIGLGTVLRTPSDKRKNIYTIFLEEKHDDPPSGAMFIMCMATLRNALINDNQYSVSLARKGEGLENLSRVSIESALRTTSEDGNLQLTLCTGEVSIPSVGNRLGIIKKVMIRA